MLNLRNLDIDAHLQLVPLYKLEVLIHTAHRLVLHLLRDVLEEARPPRRGAELRDVERAHLDPFVRGHDDPAPGDVVHVVQVIRGRYGREVRRGLFGMVKISQHADL